MLGVDMALFVTEAQKIPPNNKRQRVTTKPKQRNETEDITTNRQPTQLIKRTGITTAISCTQIYLLIILPWLPGLPPIITKGYSKHQVNELSVPTMLSFLDGICGDVQISNTCFG